MSDNRLLIPQMDEFRDELRAAIAREEAAAAAAQPVRRRRRLGRRPLAISLAALLVGAGAAATASQLISVGEPTKVPNEQPARYRPGSAAPVVAATAPDPALHASWGVAIYDAPDGQQCVFSGQVRGSQLGRIVGGTFHPFPPGTSGACRTLAPTTVVTDVTSFPTSPRRTLFFGRAGGTVAAVRFHDGAKTLARTRVGQGGAFLFVLDGPPDPRTDKLEFLDAQGHPVS
jgi:hypothetical protein